MTKELPDLKEIRTKIYESLRKSGWADKLKSHLLSEEFIETLEYLLKESLEGRRFTPKVQQMFRAFVECPYKDLKVVVIGQDPYPQPGVADGISFSCSNDGKVQASLRYMFKEIEDTVYPEGYEWNPDLKRWANQGILMLNTALTCEIGNIGSHYKTWDPFTKFLLDVLNNSNNGLIYAFLGNKSGEWAKHVSEEHYKLFATHPASAAYKKQQVWDSNDLFNRVNHILEGNNGEKIVW